MLHQKIDSIIARLHTSSIAEDDLIEQVYAEIEQHSIRLTRDDRQYVATQVLNRYTPAILQTTCPIVFDGFTIPEGHRFVNWLPSGDGWAVVYQSRSVTIHEGYGVVVGE